MLKDAKILPRFIQPISCRLCAYYKVEKTYSILELQQRAGD